MKRRLLSVFVTPRHVQYFSSRFPCRFHGKHAAAVVGSRFPGQNMDSRYLHQQPYFDNFRQWRFANNAGRKPAAGRERCEFTLMSYNILAQDLLDLHTELYAEHDPLALSWAQRYNRLMAEIYAIRPDILCLQELQENHVEQFSSGLASFDYGLLYKKRTGGEKTDGCAIFYRNELFDLVTHHAVEYYQPNVNQLNRENVAIIAQLALKSNPATKLVVSTTHLLYNPRRQDVRLAQIQVLLAELDRMAYSGQDNGKPHYHPVILCGDFNLQPHTAPYRLLAEQYLRYDRLVARTLEPEGEGYGELTGKGFLPPSLGITDHCQHDTLKDRQQAHTDAAVPSADATKLYHSKHANSPKKTEENGTNNSTPSGSKSGKGHKSPTRLFSTGSLKHRFWFNSAYRHDFYHPRAASEEQGVTTFQDRWITVDYMFYTPFRAMPQHKQQQTGADWQLELLGTYALPTVQQCSWGIGMIPNLFYGSDHFSLAGRFLLSTPVGKK